MLELFWFLDNQYRTLFLNDVLFEERGARDTVSRLVVTMIAISCCLGGLQYLSFFRFFDGFG